jgi:hypothetical protein
MEKEMQNAKSDDQNRADGKISEIEVAEKEAPDRPVLIQALGDRKEAADYLKLLGAEIAKLEISRTRHAYLVWLLVGAFFVISQKLGQVPLLSFEKIDRDLLLKGIPPAIAFFYYISISRTFLIRELGSMHVALAEELYPSEKFQFAEYISPGSFMRTERYLHRARPQDEMLGYIFFLGIIVTSAVWLPLLAFFYAYYILLTTYPFEDGILRLSLIVGIVFITQALVILRGNFLMVNQGVGGKVRLNREPMFIVEKKL